MKKTFKILLFAVLALMAGMTACDNNNPVDPPDDNPADTTITTPPDTVVTPVDTIVNPADTVVEPVDTVVIPVDTIVEPVDTIVEPVDTIDITVLRLWQAGETVSAEVVEAFGGIDKCFAAEPIPDGVWQRMQGKTYKENPYIGRNDLRHVRCLHWDYDDQMHVGEMICNVSIADRLATIFRKLFDEKYPIQRMLLPDVYDADDETQMRDNNSSCFCYRVIAGSTKLSKHARGVAVDINTLYNPYYKDRSDGTRFIQPATAAAYCDRDWDFPYKIDHNDLCFRLFTGSGFEWGGDWTSCKDYQHFELIE